MSGALQRCKALVKARTTLCQSRVANYEGRGTKTEEDLQYYTCFGHGSTSGVVVVLSLAWRSVEFRWETLIRMVAVVGVVAVTELVAVMTVVDDSPRPTTASILFGRTMYHHHPHFQNATQFSLGRSF